VTFRQTRKKAQAACGDVVQSMRTKQATTVLLCDGIGSGIKARLAATMATSRLFEFLKNGESPRRSFIATAAAINRIRKNWFPYAAFSVAHILSDGDTTIFSYDMPRPVLVLPRTATHLQSHSQTIDDAVISQTHCSLSPGDNLLLMSDGITEAGLGRDGSTGWKEEGVLRFAGSFLQQNHRANELPQKLVDEAVTNWGGDAGDDCTAVIVSCRKAHALTVLTGPPRDRALDEEVVEGFLKQEGCRAVCGAATSQMVSRVSRRPMKTSQRATSFTAPPEVRIEGIDLVTEGAVTLNQLNNIIDEDPSGFEDGAPVTKLYHLIMAADRIEFVVGDACNPGQGGISFVQNGILPRARVVDLLADRLRRKEKLVVVKGFNDDEFSGNLSR